MINPNNKELKQPNLLSGNWTNEIDPIEAIGNFAKGLQDQSEDYQPQSIVGTESEIEALNRSIGAKIASQQYVKQVYPVSNQSNEAVNHPAHYNQGDIEAIDAITAAGHAEGFCIGSCLKYLWRYKHKNGIEDLKKAQFYLNWYIDYLQKQETNNK